ncbi:DUF932 domain-containing protein [Kutzneria sp. 744]|uniref:DUF932 domain-containing protein n=1 Tax=Kutzneria sp. (strain 744) TaxID=345341 RepID=UPI0003EED9C7|nr:DUF932 domain-containing protein [Kutzneria sp. 744]EWM19663.1 hypothetical protein KUTG_09967 [Kutzneria sp. 744]
MVLLRHPAHIRNTRWGALNAIGEHLDHAGRTNSANRNALRTLTSGDVAKKKQTAFALLTS